MFVLKENESLAAHSSFRIGGVARWTTEVNTPEDLSLAIAWAKTNQVPWRVLGGGTNLLVPDEGYPGLIIWIKDKEITIDAATGIITVGAGASTAAVAGAAVAAGLTGFEWAAGVPGTIGGAVYGNAGAAGSDMAAVVQKVLIWENDVWKELSGAECALVYRGSRFKTQPAIIWRVWLKLDTAVDSSEPARKLAAVLAQRAATQPKGVFSTGCIFKNPSPLGAGQGHSAGQLIDQAGLKGSRVGGATVSPSHANFIVSDGSATAAEVLRLMAHIKQTVREKFDLDLQEEITILRP